MSAKELTKEMMERYEKLGCHYPKPQHVSTYDRSAYERMRAKHLALGLTCRGTVGTRKHKLTT